MNSQSSNAIAKNYSKALYTAAKQAGVHQTVMQELMILAEGFEAVPETREFFSNPLTPPDMKSAVADRLIQQVSSFELKETLKLMNIHDRLAFVPELQNEFKILMDKDTGTLRGTVYAASQLSDEVKKRITDKMTKFFNKQVLFNYVLSPQILGGTRIEVGGLSFDDSIEGHLHRMADDLNRSRV